MVRKYKKKKNPCIVLVHTELKEQVVEQIVDYHFSGVNEVG